jgi:hypothetical protein
MIGSFQTGTDDLRESPMVLLAGAIGGLSVLVYDPGSTFQAAWCESALHRAAWLYHIKDDDRRRPVFGRRGVGAARRRTKRRGDDDLLTRTVREIVVVGLSQSLKRSELRGQYSGTLLW